MRNVSEWTRFANKLLIFSDKVFNGSQLAKMKKNVPDMSLPCNL